MDPWYDAFALPAAPVVLAIQGAALTFSKRHTRRVVGLAGLGLVAAMFLIVAVISSSTDSGGASIGGPILAVELLLSIALAAGTWVLRDVDAATDARERRGGGARPTPSE